MPGQTEMYPKFELPEEKRPEVDVKRTVKLLPFDFRVANWPPYGDPGATMKFDGSHLSFNCPGCGRFGTIRVCGPPKEQNAWLITDGNLDELVNLTLAPSIHCVGCCGWHGYLKNGIYETC